MLLEESDWFYNHEKTPAKAKSHDDNTVSPERARICLG